MQDPLPDVGDTLAKDVPVAVQLHSTSACNNIGADDAPAPMLMAVGLTAAVAHGWFGGVWVTVMGCPAIVTEADLGAVPTNAE